MPPANINFLLAHVITYHTKAILVRKSRSVQTLSFEDIEPKLRNRYPLIHSLGNKKRYTGVTSVGNSYVAVAYISAGVETGNDYRRTLRHLGKFRDEKVAALAYSCAKASAQFRSIYSVADALFGKEAVRLPGGLQQAKSLHVSSSSFSSAPLCSLTPSASSASSSPRLSSPSSVLISSGVHNKARDMKKRNERVKDTITAGDTYARKGCEPPPEVNSNDSNIQWRQRGSSSFAAFLGGEQ